jgi:putative copper export protein
MQIVLLLLRWFHVIPAVAMVGGLLYMRFVLPKALANGTDAQFAEVRSRWAKIVMASTALLLLTGIVNMVLATKLYDYGDQKSAYSMIAGIKFLLALPVFFLAARLGGKSEGAAKMRLKSDLWLNITLGLAIVVIMVGGFLRAMPRQEIIEDGATTRAINMPSDHVASDHLASGGR